MSEVYWYQFEESNAPWSCFLSENNHKGNRSMKNYHHPHYHHLSPNLCLELLFFPSLLLISRENNTQTPIDTFMWTMFFSKRPDFRENFWFIVLLCKRTKSAPTFSLSALQHHLFFPHTHWEAIKKQVFFFRNKSLISGWGGRNS